MFMTCLEMKKNPPIFTKKNHLTSWKTINLVEKKRILKVPKVARLIIIIYVFSVHCNVDMSIYGCNACFMGQWPSWFENKTWNLKRSFCHTCTHKVLWIILSAGHKQIIAHKIWAKHIKSDAKYQKGLIQISTDNSISISS